MWIEQRDDSRERDSVMPILYGQEKTAEEVRKFVTEYVDSVKAEKRDRYHDILSLIPGGGHGEYGAGDRFIGK
jgi:hypothetical protein